MPYCTNCATQLQDDAKFCQACGHPTHAAASQPQPPQSGPAPSNVQDERIMAILAYILFFIPIIAGAHKTSPFVKFHTNQGFVLFIAEVAYAVVHSVLTSIFAALMFGVGAWFVFRIISAILGFLWLAFLGLAILGIVNVCNGKTTPLPVIGGITLLK